MNRIVFLITLIAVCITGNLGCRKSESPVTPNTPQTIFTGASSDAGSNVIPQSGGTILLNLPGTPVNGLQINVPPNAYNTARTFSISYAPITSHRLGSDFTPISPLITIANGGGYADSVMTVKIPVTVPHSMFAMAFSYDDATGLLEGLPIISCDSNAVTIQTRHFAFNTLAPRSAAGNGTTDWPRAEIVVSAIDISLLSGENTSTFVPGIDTWEFDNRGSYALPFGICSGMSASELYYFDLVNPVSNAPLFNRYATIHNKDFWFDNRRGMRLASMCQTDYVVNDETGEVRWNKYFNDAGNRPLDQLRAFAYSIRLTHMPQLIVVSRDGGGHALLVHESSGGALSACDPNWPGVPDLPITYDAVVQNFTPYTTPEKVGGAGHSYSRFSYIARSAIVPWDRLTQHWQEAEAGTIGNGCFPPYVLWANDGNGFEVYDGALVDAEDLLIQLRCPVCPSQDLGGYRFTVYNEAGLVIAKSSPNFSAALKLAPGVNHIGFLIEAMATRLCSGEEMETPQMSWVDFKWMAITSTPVPILYSVQPQIVQPGEVVTLTGKRFGAWQGDASVTFNGLRADAYPFWSDTLVRVVVPDGAGSGNVVLTALGVQSNGQYLTVLRKVEIFPDSAWPGMVVTIIGSGFGWTSPGRNGVTFVSAKYGSQMADSILSWSDTKVIATVPLNYFPGTAFADSAMVSVLLSTGEQSRGVGLKIYNRIPVDMNRTTGLSLSECCMSGVSDHFQFTGDALREAGELPQIGFSSRGLSWNNLQFSMTGGGETSSDGVTFNHTFTVSGVLDTNTRSISIQVSEYKRESVSPTSYIEWSATYVLINVPMADAGINADTIGFATALATTPPINLIQHCWQSITMSGTYQNYRHAGSSRAKTGSFVVKSGYVPEQVGLGFGR